LNIFNKPRNTEDQTDRAMEKDGSNLSDSTAQRLARLEKRINLLVGITIVQAIILTIFIVCLVVRQFMPSTLSLILMLIALAGFLYFFRARVPGWIGNFSRFVFAQMFAAQKSDSMKDIK